MVYRRFGSVYSRLLLSKQDEMSKMEATLLAWDRTDDADDNGDYLMSRPLDVEREEIPELWKGLSRVKLLEKLEKLALEYGKCPFTSVQDRSSRPSIQVPQASFRYCRSIVSRTQLPRDRTRREKEGNRRPASAARHCSLPHHSASTSAQLRF